MGEKELGENYRFDRNTTLYLRKGEAGVEEVGRGGGGSH